MLMTEIAAMRRLIKEYESDIELLRERLNTALSQSLVLRATVEIMEKRVAFLKDRHGPNDRVPVVANLTRESSAEWPPGRDKETS